MVRIVKHLHKSSGILYFPFLLIKLSRSFRTASGCTFACIPAVKHHTGLISSSLIMEGVGGDGPSTAAAALNQRRNEVSKLFQDLLNHLLIGFLSPLVDPELEPTDGPSLPTKGSDEFKPFIRRLPEFNSVEKLHERYAITKAFCIAFVMTFFSMFDVPTYKGKKPASSAGSPRAD
ncbi:protein RER1B [Sesamum angolense]|uniref:Protein RER1B n=1 Tax=Sesamum angolense TaxID=2727404 RepID=A0AAE2C170_9LAMI|nr:protein RER1B [Sesamum angolense]